MALTVRLADRRLGIAHRERDRPRGRVLGRALVGDVGDRRRGVGRSATALERDDVADPRRAVAARRGRAGERRREASCSTSRRRLARST